MGLAPSFYLVVYHSLATSRCSLSNTRSTGNHIRHVFLAHSLHLPFAQAQTPTLQQGRAGHNALTLSLSRSRSLGLCLSLCFLLFRSLLLSLFPLSSLSAVRGPEFSFSLCLSLLHTLTLTQGTVRRISVPLFPSQSRERHILLYHSLSLSLFLSLSLSLSHTPTHQITFCAARHSETRVFVLFALSHTHTCPHTHTRRK